MIVTHLDEDIFESTADIITIPVNCVGRMGKGLALQFARRAPSWAVTSYENLCEDCFLDVGRPVLLRNVFGLQHVLLFPSKRHWRDDSKLSWIQSGWTRFMRDDEQWLGSKAVATPLLGAGLGRLNPSNVFVLLTQPTTKEVHVYYDSSQLKRMLDE